VSVLRARNAEGKNSLTDLPSALRALLDPEQSPLEQPIRAEIFGPERFAQHGVSLGLTHREVYTHSKPALFFPRLEDNIRTLRRAHDYISSQSSAGYTLSAAAEWLLDNFHLIEAQIKEVRDGLPQKYFRDLPVLIDKPLAGLPRVYGVSWAFVAHTDSSFNESLLGAFLNAYQTRCELTLGELWALPTTLRVVLIENIRRLSEGLASFKAARELANRYADRLADCPLTRLDTVLHGLRRRGIGDPFLVQLSHRMGELAESEGRRVSDWLIRVAPDLPLLQMQQQEAQAASNLSMRNAITSLRSISDADWPQIIESTSPLMRLMLVLPAFRSEHDDTRTQALHAIEMLARSSGRSELQIARALVKLMRDAKGQHRSAESVALFWLAGGGRGRLAHMLDIKYPLAWRWRDTVRSSALSLYLGTIVLASVAIAGWLTLRHGVLLPTSATPLWLTLGAAVLALAPTSEAVVALVNRLISESLRPQRLPRLQFATGIPAAHRVMVVIPALLTRPETAIALAHQLELHYLANTEPQAQFALLTDWADAPTQQMADDAAILAAAKRAIEALNARYPLNSEMPPRFILLHRERSYSETERAWIGWERKRGKIEQLIRILAEPDAHAFVNLGRVSLVAKYTRYVVTLDSDTQLPPGRLRELVAVAAHPRNRPVIDFNTRRVISGYGILQPRLSTPLPTEGRLTLFHRLFAGQCGIDPYSAASSEIYQDVFDEGTFTGKGLLNVEALHIVLGGRLPNGRVLSHDLLEGSIVRCATVTDITLIEDAPFHADVAASRVHRWTRGDWQLLSFLFRRRMRLGAINRWKLFDNLRRSLVAPLSLGLMIVTLVTDVISPFAALGLIFAAYTAGGLLGAVAGLAPARGDIALGHFYRSAAREWLRAMAIGLWGVSQLFEHALLSLDAIVRALWRMLVSHRLLLQWTTAAAAEAAASVTLAQSARQHLRTMIGAIVLGGLLLVLSPHFILSSVLALLWLATPLAIWQVSRAGRTSRIALDDDDRAYLVCVARDTWRLFERHVGADDHFLPPDNLQTVPQTMLARRTSPTNIGLYLLSCACARQFGWLGTVDLVERIEATLATLATLARHRGHFLNWYDTSTALPLNPQYVSTVDSGNLSGHLLAVAEACRERLLAPFDSTTQRAALAQAAQRLAPYLTTIDACWADGSLRQLLDDTQRLWLDDVQRIAEALVAIDNGHAKLASMVGIDETFVTLLDDFLATLRAAWRDIEAQRRAEGSRMLAARLAVIAARCEQLALEPDFGFLYHPKRQLFHIGLRVAEQALDRSFYDLLSSESRLTSLVAIGKGDVPVEHWATLGRPFYAVKREVGMRSWSGSMFEYLMPSLVLDEPRDSALDAACRSAVLEQIEFARTLGVVWGISESAYAAQDHTLAYQYAPQGVPRLALRRTPPDELVIAPYATLLAAQIDPAAALANLRRLETLGARGQYGFIDALDFTPSRQIGSDSYTRVHTFMAHHQGMAIVALANVLLEATPQRWGMASARIEAMASLLHERVPNQVSIFLAPPTAPPPQARDRRSARFVREIVPGVAAVDPTHLLSNGRYSVALRPNGAGWSRWQRHFVSRWRDDALRDQYGHFIYLRRSGQARVQSLTQHPAPDPSAHYLAAYHIDRVCYSASWFDLVDTLMTVWVSPEDDIEFRRVELHNTTDETLEIDLLSAFELTLADARADEAHPAFGNLFVRSQWLGTHDALVFERRARLANEQGVHAAHFLAISDSNMQSLAVQTDRLDWIGRNRTASDPAALVYDPSTRMDSEQMLDCGLDPVAVLSVRLRIPAQARASVTFATAVAGDANTLRAVVDKYRQPSTTDRASMMSATLAAIRLRESRLNADNHAAIQALTSALVLTLTRPLGVGVGQSTHSLHPGSCNRSLLWRFGISGDRPIVLVSIGVAQGLAALRTLALGLRVWSWGGVECDLVVINSEPMSYYMGLQRDIAALREIFQTQSANQAGLVENGFYALRSDELGSGELDTLRLLARIHVNADGRPLVHHVDEWLAAHTRYLESRLDISGTALTQVHAIGARPEISSGRFVDPDSEFHFSVDPRLRPPRPWINVLANPGFGAQISEAGGGYSWAVNSRLNQLTPWSNDPVGDPPGEWFVLQNLRTGKAWSIAAGAWAHPDARYQVVHGQGFTRITHRVGDIDIVATWCVDDQDAVKQIGIRLTHRGDGVARLRLLGMVEWIMGANRSDRISAATSLRSSEHGLPVLLCTQTERSAGFGDGTAFFAVVGQAADRPATQLDWSCDRREFFDARGRIMIPDQLGQRSGKRLDPCAAWLLNVTLAPGESQERVFLLGYGADADAALALASRAATVASAARLDTVRAHWNRLLSSTIVKTPDPLFDALVNRWLLYQTVACRLWAKAGFYQAGGAYGFRDQLQDAMALADAAPAMLRAQILLAASRQFAEGDVQHWWHAPTGAGVRTHFSDDLLWLPYASAHYLARTGDDAILDQPVHYLEGEPIPEGAEDAYYAPRQSEEADSLYEHCARAIDRSLAVGSHGLPLMGTGDWNDGMNRVGHLGRGESVWMGWFLYSVIDAFAPLADARDDLDRAANWRRAQGLLQLALIEHGWDGQWFKRAYFDDGSELGTRHNAECQIDLIAQAWSVLSDAAPRAYQEIAVAALDERLVDRDAKLIRLLDPPLQHAEPSAGYIQAYPPGVRENGGQYSHAAVWALMAQARLGNGDRAYEYFTCLSPAHRSQTPAGAAVYQLEPYVMAGDIYSQPPYSGRGGWSWYTGSAAWLYRAAHETMFGLQLNQDEFALLPSLPSHWLEARVSVTCGGQQVHFVLLRAPDGGWNDEQLQDQLKTHHARLLNVGQAMRWDACVTDETFVLILP
jgi:cyclic beta-1,2-glucan synthetase